MMASHGLLLETMRAEANHAQVKNKIDELARHHAAQEQQVLADLDSKVRAIDAQFQKQRAEMAGQLQESLRESIEQALGQKRDLEISVLRATHQEQANERKKLYAEQKRKYDEELFAAINALMSLGPAMSPARPPASPSQPREVSHSVPAPVASDLATAAEPTPVPPAATEVPSQPQQVPSLPPTPVPTKANRQPTPSRDGPFEQVRERSPPSFAVRSQDAPTPAHQQPRPDEQKLGRPASPAKPPLEQPVSPAPVVERESLSAKPTVDPARQNRTPVPSNPTPKADGAHKRKANGETNGQSPAPSRGKRAKLEKANGADKSPVVQSPAVPRSASERTVSFDDVYGAPGKPVSYNHIIVQFPPAGGDFYILRCNEHGVHFGEHPLRGAAKHLASAQHGYMSKAHVTAIDTLGHRVLGCTKELADENNRKVLQAFKEGYKVFNANNLSQTKRAELGYPPLDPLNSQKVAMHRKQMAGITAPVPGRFYVGSGGASKCPVLVLPWGDMAAAGLIGSLVDTFIFGTKGGSSRGIPDLPKCYDYLRLDKGQVMGIKGWAKGYETGGPLERKREFPVLCAENTDCRLWTVGWVKAVDLSTLDFDDPSARTIPFFREARDYFMKCILPRQGVRETEMRDAYGTSTPRQSNHQRSQQGAPNAAAEDVEMKDAGDVHNSDSDADSIGKGMTDSDNGVGMADEESRRTSVSNRDEPLDDTGKATANAQLIAAQALNLGAPARGGFTAINGGGTADGSTSQSARASLEPPSRAGSVSSTGGGHRRVFKIHARSSARNPTNQAHATPSMVLPERPADGTASPNDAPAQPQGDVRKPSPASLQNILQDFPAVGSPRVSSQSPKPAGARRPLPSAPMRGSSPSRSALLSTVNTKLAESLRESRAGSAPVQLPQHRDPVAEEIRRSGSASAAPGPSRHATPQPVRTLAPAPEPMTAPAPAAAPEPATTTAPEPAAATAPTAVPEPVTAPAPEPAAAPVAAPEPTAASAPEPAPAPVAATAAAAAATPEPKRDQPPPPIQLPLPPTNLTTILHVNTTTPLATPTASAVNTRANSPALTHPKTDTPTTTTTSTTTASFPHPETPSLTPTLTTPTQQPSGFLPTMDVFDIAGFMDGTTELFRSPTPGRYLRLIDDHQSGVFTTPSDAPVQIKLEPKKIERVERVSVQGGAVCVVTIVCRPEEEDGAEGRVWTLVLEKARSTASGVSNGMAHARRLCRRLVIWNGEIVCPGPRTEVEGVRWRFESGSGSGSVCASPAGMVMTPPVTGGGGGVEELK